MTQAEKHALIAERLEGWTQLYILSGCMGQIACGWSPTHTTMQPVPDYSNDLDICARVEHRIAKLGMFGAYMQMLVLTKARIEVSDGWDSVAVEVALRATAADRVNAMVALIQSMEQPK